MSEIRELIETDDDKWFTFRFRMSEGAAHMDFEVWEVNGQAMDDLSYHYTRKGAISSDDITTNLDEAQTFMEGSLKWDGCVNLTTGEPQSTGGYFHFCSNPADSFKFVWDEIYARGREWIKDNIIK